MKICFHKTGAEFLARAGDFLHQNEAANTMILGLAPTADPASALFLTLEDMNGTVKSAALQMPPFNLLISFCDEAGLKEIADALFARGARFPGVVGPKEESRWFAQYWSTLVNQQMKLGFQQRIMRVDNLIPAKCVDGGFRQATLRDDVLMCDWSMAFFQEALPQEAHSVDRIQRMTRSRLENGELYLWEFNGHPVSMAGISGQTTNGIRVVTVYTPPELRGRGFGAAVVSDLTKKMLQNGRRYCCLYTDLANPTSNQLYLKLGYERVCDSSYYLFV